jgi:signal transduction histidine kinase
VRRLGLTPRRLALVAGGEALLIAWWLAPLYDEHGKLLTSADAGLAAAFLLCGVVASRVSPGDLAGPLMLIAAPLLVANAAHDATLDPWRFTPGLILEEAGMPILFALVLSYPRRPLLRPWPVLLVSAAAVATWGWGVVAAEWEPPAAVCWTCPPAGNALFSGPAPFDYEAANATVDDLRLVLWGLLAATLLLRLVRSRAHQRKLLAPVAVVAALLGIKLILDDVYLLDAYALWPGQERDVGAIPNTVLTALVAVALTATALRTSVTDSPLGTLVDQLARADSTYSVRDLLAGALADPELEIGYWSPSERAYVDAEGRALRPRAGRVTTVVRAHDGSALATLVHDPSVGIDDRLLEAVTAAAGLAIERERLHAELRAQLTATAESRGRLLEAADAERRRIERALREGSHRRLDRLAARLDELMVDGDEEVAQTIAELRAAIDSARDQLLALARGVLPAAIEHGGLSPALGELAAASPIPVELACVSGHRQPRAVEATAYFVCSEGVTNAAKHARAHAVSIAVRSTGDALVVEVTDDGVGGARLDGSGSGLQGLADRVAALGGTLEVVSPPAGGTRLIAWLPDGFQARA